LLGRAISVPRHRAVSQAHLRCVRRAADALGRGLEPAARHLSRMRRAVLQGARLPFGKRQGMDPGQDARDRAELAGVAMRKTARRGRLRHATAGVAVLLALTLAGAADGQSRRNLVCNLTSKLNDDLIRNCTDLIQSGRDIGRPLADSYIARGRAYMAKS